MSQRKIELMAMLVGGVIIKKSVIVNIGGQRASIGQHNQGWAICYPHPSATQTRITCDAPSTVLDWINKLRNT